MNDSRPTCEDVARAALAACDNQIGIILACQWVSERVANVASRTALGQLRAIGAVRVPGVITAGTIDATLGSTAVTGDATAVAAWSPDMVGRYFSTTGGVWYEIASVEITSATVKTLQLAVPFAETTVADGAYRVVARHVALIPEARRLGEFNHLGHGGRLDVWTQADMAERNPERQYWTGGPLVVIDVGVNADGQRVVEFYPYAQDPEIIQYVYWKQPPLLQLKDHLPPYMDLYALKEGVLIDVYRYLASRAARLNQLEVAAYYRNEMRTQETRWEAYVLQILAQDRGLEDAHFRVQSSLGLGNGGDIATARQHVYSTWSWG